jgi:glycerate kinase
MKISSLVVAVDVQNTLLGPKGATRVYGPQKGIRESDFNKAEACLRQLARVMACSTKFDYAKQPGSGAAGGLGFGLAAFLGARFEPGFDLFSRYAGLPRQLTWADLVITGEGAIDESTLMGKGVGEIARQCRRRKIPCIGLAGVVSPKARQDGLFIETHALTDLTASSAARARASFYLEKLALECAKRSTGPLT